MTLRYRSILDLYESNQSSGLLGLSVERASCFSIHSNAMSVTCSTGLSNRYGSTGTIASPVAVGPHVRTRGLCTLANAFFACLTAVCIVNAGSALEAESII